MTEPFRDAHRRRIEKRIRSIDDSIPVRNETIDHIDYHSRRRIDA
jgi:hypothetical protein